MADAVADVGTEEYEGGALPEKVGYVYLGVADGGEAARCAEVEDDEYDNDEAPPGGYEDDGCSEAAARC